MNIQLIASLLSYFDNIARIAQHDYMPNDQDVLRSRVKTTGITETTFIIGELTYRMFDVGGQRSERKKWIHCFENVTTILFLVAISEYDQLLFEDETVNRMQEALTLFDSICNSRWFIKTSIILFLNKIDRFKEKLPVSPMKNYFPDYEGGDDYASACDYILNRFVSLNQHETKQIYTHFTCATDTTQIRFVMAAVNGKSIIKYSRAHLLIFPQISLSKRISDCAVSSNSYQQTNEDTRLRRGNWLRTGPFHHQFIRRSFQNLGFQYPATSATSHVLVSSMQDRERAVPFFWPLFG